MANNIKALASTNIGSTSATAPTLIYAPSGTKSALISAIALFNSGNAIVDVLLTSRPDPSSNYPVIHKQASLAIGSGVRLTDLISLSGQHSDSISGYLSPPGSAVSCILFGIERD